MSIFTKNKDRWYPWYASLFFRYDREKELQKITAYLQRNNKLIDSGKKIRVYIALPFNNWEKAGLLDTWQKMLNVEVVFFQINETYDQYAPGWQKSGKQLFNDELLQRVRDENKKMKIDLFFSYMSGRWVFGETVRQIGEMGIITVNFGFDDNHKFWGKKAKSGWTGNGEIAPFYDINLTAQSSSDLVKFKAVDARALFVTPGGNVDVFGACRPTKVRDIPVSFIGQKYGEREEMVNFLKEQGIDVVVKGRGWAAGEVSLEEMLATYEHSLMTLGFGFMSGRHGTSLKGRDFEVPLSGVAYITTYNSELANYFKDGKEIVFYRSQEELLEKIKYYLEHPDEVIAIGDAGRKRAMHEYLWENQWQMLLDVCQGKIDTTY